VELEELLGYLLGARFNSQFIYDNAYYSRCEAWW